MANPEHVEIVKQGAERIRAWRRENPAAVLDLSNADLAKADLRGAPLIGASLREAVLAGADLRLADLSGADLYRAQATGAVLSEAFLIRATLSDAFLAEADLGGAVLNRAHLSRADLAKATLSGAALRGAFLGSAVLSGATLRGAALNEADLSGASLRGADLREAVLHAANLRGADLSESVCGWTIFGLVNLTAVTGLEAIRHQGPSTVGVDTLYKSRGHIPVAFLRGCGVPEELVTYLPSLIGSLEPIQFYSCFISHSSKDEAFARELHARMRKERLRVWYAPEDMQSGQKIQEQIDRAIRVFDKLLLVLSANSMNSEWVKTEIHKARQREVREKRRMLFPIALAPFEAIRAWEYFDSDTGKDLAREVREYFIPDFSAWRDEAAFEKAFARLLKDLRAEEKAAGTDPK